MDRTDTGSTTVLTTDGLTVRVARDDELDAAGRAVRDAYAADGFAVGGYLDTLADARSRADDATVAVAVDPGGAVLGSVTFALPGSRWAELSRPGEAEFRALGVSPTARGRGVGNALAQWCVAESRRLGATRLVICSLDVMHGAHRIYGRLGFVRRPELDWTPDPGVHLLAFSLDL
jgi:GNAT superfamily N-acetyltransferase